MRQRRKLIIGCLGLAIAILSVARAANAIGFTWIAGDGDWHVPQFWAPFTPPAIIGPPGLGDSALIVGDRNVSLSGDAQGLAGMVLQAEADVFTSGNQLTVVNLGGTAQSSARGSAATTPSCLCNPSAEQHLDSSVIMLIFPMAVN